MNWRSPFETKVLLAFAAAVLVVAALAVTTWKVSQDAVVAMLRVTHTHELLNHLARAKADSLAIELSTQSYRITGDAARLAERDAAIAAREISLRRIEELTLGKARQQARWTRLREVVDQRLAISRKTELLRQTEGPEAANAYVAGAPLKETRERLFQLLGEMDAEERLLLAERSAAQQQARQITVAAGTLATLALAALLAATYGLIRRQLRAIEASRQALATSEENLAITLDSIGDAVLATDAQGRVTRMNPVAERLTGWPAAEAQGRPVDEVFCIVNEQTRASAVVPVAQVLVTGQTQGLANHTVLIARDGREWPVADSAAPIRDASGRVSGVVLVFRDVSAERQAARMIRDQNELLEQRVREQTARWHESEEQQRLIIESVRDYAILMLDPVGHVVTWNLGAERIKGYAADEIIGQHFSCFYLPADVACGKPDAELAIAAREGRFEEEGLRVRKSGATFWANVVITPVRKPAGELHGFVKITRDITERKRTEAALELERSKLAAAFENVDIGLVICDAQGGDLSMNAAALKFYGFTSTDDMLRRVGEYADEWELRYPDGRIMPYDEWPLVRAVRGDHVRDYDSRLHNIKTGHTWACSYTSAPVRNSAGDVILIVMTLLDITERKRAEQEILDLNASLERRVTERTRRLEEVSRAKSDFLANMSHELRTPLNSIIGFSEMLKDGLLGELNTKQSGFISDIFGAGTHLLSLINDILDLSKVEAGMLQLEAGVVDLAALLKASTLVVREKALAHRIRLDTQLDPALGAMLADERKLKQIVYNLLANAVKFTPEGGAVTLAARRCMRSEVVPEAAMPVRLVAPPPGEDREFLAITVEDNGVGIAAEDLPKLFEPFMQVDSSVARRQDGTGLGLSLVRRFAELHGGTVGVASRPGVGSRFCVWLPYRAAAAPAVQPVSTFADLAGIATPAVPLALVVEDDDRMADLIAAQLRAEGFAVMRAATAEEGLVRAAKHQPQLITLDIFLPAMDGWEFMRQLKANPRLVDTPVVIITVSADLDRGLALGARRVLHKPFRREELLAALAGLDARPNGAPARVLVVDDNVQAVELVATVLEAEGYRVLRAYGGAEAIEVARSARPDLVILDLMMPEVSGFEVAHALRASEQTARIPILVLTAMALSAEDHARLNGAVSAILSKSSFSRDELFAELHRAIAVRPTD